VTCAFRRALDHIPEGYSEGLYEGRRYRVEKTVLAGGKSLKLVAWEMGGPDYISLNLYTLASGDRLNPCEMPEDKVRAFVTGLEPASG
jgi:hypothetical protein